MLSKIILNVGLFIEKSFDTPIKVVAAISGVLWAWLEPTMPFIVVCTFFVFLDCMSAFMLSRRVMKAFPDRAKDGKFKSEYANEIFNTLAIIYMLVIGGYWLDEKVLYFVDVHIGNWIAAAFCMVQIVSVLENASSCNGSTWARVVQRVLVDKTKRHLKIDIEKILRETKDGEREEDTTSENEDSDNEE